MKPTILLITSLLALSLKSDAQHVEQYCELIVTSRLISKKVDISINSGEDRLPTPWLSGDTLANVKKITNAVDALNYLGSRGWKLVIAFPVVSSETGGFAENHFVLKKEFEASELKVVEQGE